MTDKEPINKKRRINDKELQLEEAELERVIEVYSNLITDTVRISMSISFQNHKITSLYRAKVG